MEEYQNLYFRQLCSNLFEINNDVEAVILSNADGNILQEVKKEEIDMETISDLTSLIHPVIERIRKEFAIQEFGTASLNTEDHRILFVSVNQTIFMIYVINPEASIDRVTSYAYFLAEKTAQILDANNDDEIQLIIPKFEYETKKKSYLKNQIYQTHLDDGKTYRYKFILVGDEKVGKTSIVRRFTENKFSDDYRATIGLNLISHTIKFINNSIELLIWDIGAQKYFKRFRETYYQAAQAVLIVFDLTNKESYNNIQIWFDEVKNFIDINDISIIIVGNKSDLKNQRQIEYKQGVDITNSLYRQGISNISYIETSALTGENVNEAFRLISYHYIMKNKEFEEEKLKHNIKAEIDLILENKEDLIVSFISENQYWNPGLQILSNIASKYSLEKSTDIGNIKKYEYKNGLIIKSYDFNFDKIDYSDAIICLFDGRNKTHTNVKWKDIIKKIIDSNTPKQIILVGIRVNEYTDWTSLINGFNINEQLENKNISLLLVKIGEKYRIEIFDHLQIMFETLKRLL
ncbi:MAG: GTP-binding protein [Candidatus Lokiarchaeota archaeon]|nr:GTP-binding protein [Candidatus Lokiarchaeota archaeon]